MPLLKMEMLAKKLNRIDSSYLSVAMSVLNLSHPPSFTLDITASSITIDHVYNDQVPTLLGYGAILARGRFDLWYLARHTNNGYPKYL